ncbi:DNA breaking-rejoining protein [Paracoccus sp. SM22M-07]|uniref:DNA breaking-rejoining protein n=1 Tax=Paracoccus sp. SM22M-07 TaxID=1520813 RepID=UPI0009100A48|nr:DNA breaking-rejoining protein [Paracoccus sp. SM22M-07]OJH44269.1 DNA breaking-rejoining protein [Paracoccus sp. SM22M-07]
MKRHIAWLTAVTILAGGPTGADTVRHETVRLARGTSGTTLTGQVRGYDSVQYALGVTAGQTLDVQLDGNNSSLYFNVTAAGSSAALYNSSIDGNGASITIPSSGTYLIDVYLMRNAARRNETATYSLPLYVE